MGHAYLPRLALLAALAPAPVWAQDMIELDPIVIFGGFTPIPVEAYGRAHTIVTADEIAERGITSVQEALRATPGVSVTSTGEAFTKIRLRGGDAKHVLVLIDGIEANVSGSGEYIFSGLDTADIERIEVLRGPQSTIYGSNAMSGVISIVTKRADRPGRQIGGGLEFGSDGTKAADFFLRQRGERGELSFSAVARHAGGYDHSRTGGDKDGNDRETLNLSGQYRLTETVTAGFTLRRTWQHYHYDEDEFVPVAAPEFYLVDSPANARRNERFGSLWLEAGTLDGRLTHRLTFAGQTQDTAHRDGFWGPSDDRNTWRSVKYLASFGLDGRPAAEAAHRLNFAAEYETEAYRSSFAGPVPFERNSRALALEYQGRLASGIDLQAGLRRDFNDVFKDATTWNASVSWAVPGRDIRLRASAGKAVVNPTMFQQFGFVPGFYQGNPNLRPEHNIGLDIGADIGFAGGRGALGVTLFQNRLKDAIAGSGDTSVNLPGTSRAKGAEISLSYHATDWLRLAGSYTYTDARDPGGAVLPQRPRHELGLAATVETFGGRGTVTADLRHVSGNHDSEWWRDPFAFPAPVAKLPAYTTVNLSATYRVSDNVQLTGRITNLFDKDYSESWGYYGQGRTAYIGVKTVW